MDPLVPLAFAVQSGRGAYVLLLGSGVSRSSEIKTGWEILTDLIGKVAQLSGADPGADPDDWYRTTFGEEPDYSRVIERLAPTAAERQALLRSYFEPTPEEREQGTKTPSTAHRAIAQLVAKGYIRVVITTNFDRLLEDALGEAGVKPYVVRSSIDVAGMPAPAQLDCLVVKAHGDYLDQRLRNTPSELATYEPELDALLDRLIGDYGLVIVGWSGEWDGALRDALRRSPNRRFTTFWTSRGELSQGAKDLSENRGAQLVTIVDADSFFTQLTEKVMALEEMRERAPVSADLAVATAKRQLADPSGRIRLRDLIIREVDAAAAVVNEVSARPAIPSQEEYEHRLVRMEAGTASLASVAATVGFWGVADQIAPLSEAIRRLGSQPHASGYVHLNHLRRYPAALVLYGGALGAVAAERYYTIAALTKTSVRIEDKSLLAASGLLAQDVLEHSMINVIEQRESGKNLNFNTPASDRMRDQMRAATMDVVRDEEHFDRLFDQVEALMGLIYAEQMGERFGFPTGRHAWRNRYDDGGGMLGQLASDLERQGAQWPPIVAGIFPSAEHAAKLIDSYRSQLRQHPMGW